MGCLTPPSHRSVRMKFVVILFFLLLGVVLGDPRYGGYGGYRGGYRGYGGFRGGHHVRYGKRSADTDAAPDADARHRGGFGHRGGYGGYRGGFGYRGHYGKRNAEPEPGRGRVIYGHRGYGGYGYRG